MRRQCGFTLVELMAGLGLLATALGLFTLAELTARRTVERHAAVLDIQQESARISHFLRQDVGAALAVELGAPHSKDSREPHVLVKLAMAGRTPAGDPKPAVRDQIMYLLVPEGDTRWRLDRIVEPVKGSDVEAESRILARRLLSTAVTCEGRQVQIRYELQPHTRLTASGKSQHHRMHIERRPALGGAAW